MRYRWRLPIEVVWWVETVIVCALIVSPGIAAGLQLTPFFLPVLIVYVRHGRSLGRAAYGYSAVVITVEALAVFSIPLSGPPFVAREWALWIPGAGVMTLLVVLAWLPKRVERNNGRVPWRGALE